LNIGMIDMMVMRARLRWIKRRGLSQLQNGRVAQVDRASAF